MPELRSLDHSDNPQWNDHELFMNGSWTVHVQFMNTYSWTVHEHLFMNCSWTIHEHEVAKFMKLVRFMNLEFINVSSWIVHEL